MLLALPMSMKITTLLLLTGLVNLYEAALSRQFSFSTAFTTVLAIKIILFVAMLATMRSSMKTGAMNRMVKAHAAIVAMGAVALLLGLWLIGT